MRKLLIILGLVVTVTSRAQLQNANWCFGVNARVNFNTTPPTPMLSEIDWNNPGASVQGASVSDATGQLRFYTDGINVWDKNDQSMLNGSGLFGSTENTVQQNFVIVPKPGNPYLYYIFTLGAIWEHGTGTPPASRGGIHYSVVDMSSGTGQVVLGLKNVVINNHNGDPIDYPFDYNHTEDNPVFVHIKSRITTALHADGDKIWVTIIPDFYFNQQHTRYYYQFLVTASGINGLADGISPQPLNPILLDPLNYPNHTGFGVMKVSPDGQFLCDAEDIVNLYNFNNQTGDISFNTTVYSFPWDGSHTTGFGLEFSPNSQLIYFTDNPYGILQSGFNTDTSVIKNYASLYQYQIQNQRLRIIFDYPPPSSDIITPLPVVAPFGLQLGMDNKIYVCAFGTLQQYRNYLGVINLPDVVGLGCNFVPNGLQLLPNTFQNGTLPQWVHKASLCINLPLIN